jgi:hypothetical protein
VDGFGAAFRRDSGGEASISVTVGLDKAIGPVRIDLCWRLSDKQQRQDLRPWSGA